MNPKITCVCCTYCRPRQLANAIACFEWQDYPNRELVILDDVGQYDNQKGDRWSLVSVKDRFETLGAKRNMSVQMVSGDTDLVAVWDDDDIYLPNHLSAIVKSLEGKGEYSIPRTLYTLASSGVIKLKHNNFMFHGSWGYTLEAFNRVDGYPLMNSGQDQQLLKRFHKAGVQQVYTTDFDPKPSYIYRWFAKKGDFHVSAHGTDYPQLSNRPHEFVGKITPKLEQDWLKLLD